MPLEPTPYLDLVRNSDDEGDWGDAHRSNLGIIDAAIERIETQPPTSNQFEFDYGDNDDDSPVYFGKARMDVALDDPEWTITKFYYDGDRVDHTVVKADMAWTNRATPVVPWP